MVRRRGVLFVMAMCLPISVLAEPPQSTVAPKLAAAPAAKPSAAVSPVAAHTLENADLEAFFDGIVPLQLERSDVGGATVLVMKDGKELLKKGYGFAELSKKKPVDPETTMFRLASISKLFTWISVMQLVEQGKLDLDADVNKYLIFRLLPLLASPSLFAT
jgi:CubicO group peptidase (beta-lactamase class C family)